MSSQSSSLPPLATKAGWFQSWRCQSPGCVERSGQRPWYKRPYAIELQGGRCCSPDCLQHAIVRLAGDLLPRGEAPAPRAHRIPLGLLLLSRNVIDAEQLRGALEAQKQNGRGRLGEWLRREHGVPEEQITAAVALQWARPLFPLPESPTWRQCRGWLPLGLMHTLSMAPLHFAADQQCLYVGFSQTVAFHALHAVQEIYGCRTEACIIGDSDLERIETEFRRSSVHPAAVDLRFDGSSLEEIGAIVREHAQRLLTRQIRMTAVAPFIWVRLQGEHASHLLFRAPRPAAFTAASGALSA